jgi:deoxyadenosine/deoxycytidine kinase
MYISVAGTIGAGKTLLVEALASALDLDAYLEAVDDNPFLADYYADPTRFALPAQLFYLVDAVRVAQSVNDRGGIQDRSLAEAFEVFVRLLARRGQLSEQEFRLLNDWYQATSPLLAQPDLRIFLDISPALAADRIVIRDRVYEREIDREFLEQLDQAYRQWLTWDPVPLLVVDAARRDLRQAREQHLLIAEIRQLSDQRE